MPRLMTRHALGDLRGARNSTSLEVSMAGMTQGEIDLLVHKYVGGEGGYLFGFSYADHDSFYVDYCDMLGIDVPGKREIYGTTKKTFIGILKESTPGDQARIIRGVLMRFPPGDFQGNSAPSKVETGAQLLVVAQRLEGSVVAHAEPAATTETVQRALADAEALLKTSGATSAVDRVHTAFHGHLRHLCSQARIVISYDEPNATQLLTALVNGHPRFQLPEPRRQDIRTILRSATAILDAIGTIRNRASLAHPNEVLVDEDEAWLVINLARSLFHYLDQKLTVRPYARSSAQPLTL